MWSLGTDYLEPVLWATVYAGAVASGLILGNALHARRSAAARIGSFALVVFAATLAVNWGGDFLPNSWMWQYTIGWSITSLVVAMVVSRSLPGLKGIALATLYAGVSSGGLWLLAHVAIGGGDIRLAWSIAGLRQLLTSMSFGGLVGFVENTARLPTVRMIEPRA